MIKYSPAGELVKCQKNNKKDTEGQFLSTTIYIIVVRKAEENAHVACGR